MTEGIFTFEIDYPHVTLRFPDYPHAHFTYFETSILLMLVKAHGRVLPKAYVYDSLYTDRDNVDAKIIDIYICKLRRKIKKYQLPLEIKTSWGRGFSLEFK